MDRPAPSLARERQGFEQPMRFSLEDADCYAIVGGGFPRDFEQVREENLVNADRLWDALERQDPLRRKV